MIDQGIVRGIINMKSAIDDNLGFAIPIRYLRPLLEKPNPVTMDRWVRLGRINEKKWKTVFGATWQERGGSDFRERSRHRIWRAFTLLINKVAARTSLRDRNSPSDWTTRQVQQELPFTPMANIATMAFTQATETCA